MVEALIRIAPTAGDGEMPARRTPRRDRDAVLLGAALLAMPVITSRTIEAARTDPR